jgi:hypothetical protein
MRKSYDVYLNDHQVPKNQYGIARLNHWQEGHRASAYMPEVLELIRKGSEFAVPRDPDHESRIEVAVGIQFHWNSFLRGLAIETSYYSHYLASRRRHAEALITVLDFARNLRYGTFMDFLSMTTVISTLMHEAERLLLTALPKYAYVSAMHSQRLQSGSKTLFCTQSSSFAESTKKN